MKNSESAEVGIEPPSPPWNRGHITLMLSARMALIRPCCRRAQQKTASLRNPPSPIHAA